MVSKSTQCQANVLAEPSKPSTSLDLHPAEAFAQTLLSQSSASLADLLKLFDLLPHEPAPAAGRAMAGGFSFGSGAWVHGNQVGLRNNTFSFPLSTRVFTRHVARHCPAHFQFSSIVILDSVCTVAHRDCHSDPSSQNAVFGRSDFSGGEVWVQREGCLTPFVANGQSLSGDALPTRPGPALFAAHQTLHATLGDASSWSRTRPLSSTSCCPAARIQTVCIWAWLCFDCRACCPCQGPAYGVALGSCLCRSLCFA